MTAPLAQIVSGDYDNKAFDLQTHYAGFTRRAMSEEDLARLSWAQKRLPPGHIGYKVWIYIVSGADRSTYCEIAKWCVALGPTIARLKPRLQFRSRQYVLSYKPEWGVWACIDGLDLALHQKCPSLRQRARQFGCDREAYGRIRNFVGGALLRAFSQYEAALRAEFMQERKEAS